MTTSIQDLGYAGANGAWRNYEVYDTPASGPRKPHKDEIAAFVDAVSAATTANSKIFYASAAGLVEGIDNTTAFNSLLTSIYNVGGGTLIVDGMYPVNSDQITFPNDGAGGATGPQQPAIRIVGLAPQPYFNQPGSSIPISPCGFDLIYDAAAAKFSTRGRGVVEFCNLTLMDSGSDAAAFIHTTLTAVLVHDCHFIGTASNTNACNDAIIYGGTGTTVDGTANAPFQGYGSRAWNNAFSKIRRPATFNTYANAIWFDHNTIDNTCGSNETLAITAGTNASPAVFTVAGHGFNIGTTIRLPLRGFTGSWSTFNGYKTAIIIDADTFSIAVDSGAFGGMAGSPVINVGAPLVFNGHSTSDGGNYIESNLVEMISYGFFADLIGGGRDNFAHNDLWDMASIAACRLNAAYATGGVYISGRHDGNFPLFQGDYSFWTFFDPTMGPQGNQVGTNASTGCNFTINGSGKLSVNCTQGLYVPNGGIVLANGNTISGAASVAVTSAGYFQAGSGGFYLPDPSGSGLARIYTDGAGLKIEYANTTVKTIVTYP